VFCVSPGLGPRRRSRSLFLKFHGTPL
jgi:hypothetical protein